MSLFIEWSNDIMYSCEPTQKTNIEPNVVICNQLISFELTLLRLFVEDSICANPGVARTLKKAIIATTFILIQNNV